MFIYLGLGLPTDFVQSVFGVPSTQQIDTERVGLPVFDNPMSKRVRGIVESIQKERTRCMRVRIFIILSFKTESHSISFQDCARSSTRQAWGCLAAFPDRGSWRKWLRELRGLPLLHAQGDSIASELERFKDRDPILQAAGEERRVPELFSDPREEHAIPETDGKMVKIYLKVLLKKKIHFAEVKKIFNTEYLRLIAIIIFLMKTVYCGCGNDHPT